MRIASTADKVQEVKGYTGIIDFIRSIIIILIFIILEIYEIIRSNTVYTLIRAYNTTERRGTRYGTVAVYAV